MDGARWVGHRREGGAIGREKARLECLNGWSLDGLDTATLARRRTEPMLWIHDTADREVAFAGGEEVVASWPGARLHPTTGLGHRRVLEHPEIVAKVLAFHHDPASPDTSPSS